MPGWMRAVGISIALLLGCATALAQDRPAACGATTAPPAPDSWVKAGALPKTFLGDGTTTLEDAFTSLLKSKETSAALAGPASTVPFVVPSVPKGSLDPTRTARLRALEDDVAAAWRTLVSDVDAKLAAAARGEDTRPQGDPAELAALRKALGKDAEIADRYRANMLESGRPYAKAKIAKLAKDPSGAAYLALAREQRATHGGLSDALDGLKNALGAHAGAIAAWKAGGDVIREPSGAIGVVRFPNGATLTPTFEKGELVAYELRSSKGDVRYFRKTEGGDEKWQSGADKYKPMVPDADDVVLNADGTLERRVGKTTQIVRPDGTVTTSTSGPKADVFVRDTDGRLLAVGMKDRPRGEFATFEYDKEGRLVGYVDPVRKRELRKTDDGWTDVKDGRRVRFDGEVAVFGKDVVLVPTDPERTSVLTHKIFRIIGGVPRIHVMTKGGNYVESQDSDDKKVLQAMAALKAADNVVTIKRAGRELGDKPLYDTSSNPFVKALRDGGIASEGHTIDVGDSARKWDPRRPGGVGDITNPSFVFTTEKSIDQMRITVVDARTGRENVLKIAKEDYDAVTKLFVEAKKAGRVPQGESFPAFYAAHERSMRARYEASDKALFEAMRALVGDAEMLKLGYRDPVLTREAKGGLLASLDGRVFLDDNRRKNFEINVRSRARLLAEPLAKAARQAKERVALARLGKWAELEKLEQKEGPIALDTVVRLADNFAEGLPSEKGHPDMVRFLGAVKTGVRNSFKGMVEGAIEHPTMTAGFIALAIVAPHVATIGGVAYMLPEALTTMTLGVDMMVKASAAGDDEAFWKGAAMVAQGATDTAIVLAPVFAEMVVAKRPAPKANGKPTNFAEMPAKDLQRSLAKNHPEVVKQLEAGGEAAAKRAMNAWEHAAKQPGAPLSPEFQASLAEARAAYNELARRNGWGPSAPEAPAKVGVPEPKPGGTPAAVEVPGKTKTPKAEPKPLTEAQLGKVEKTLGGEGKLEPLAKDGLDRAKGNGNHELLREVYEMTLRADAANEAAAKKGTSAKDAAGHKATADTLRERALGRLREYALANTSGEPLKRAEAKALERLADGDAKALQGMEEARAEGQHKELRRTLREAETKAPAEAKKFVVEELRGMKNARAKWRADAQARAAQARTLMDEMRAERQKTDGTKYVDGKGGHQKGREWWTKREGEVPTSEKALLEEVKTGRPTYTKPVDGSKGRPTWHEDKLYKSVKYLEARIADMKRILKEVPGLEGADPGVTRAMEKEIARSEARVKAMRDALDVWERRSGNPAEWDANGHSKKLTPGEPQFDDVRGAPPAE